MTYHACSRTFNPLVHSFTYTGNVISSHLKLFTTLQPSRSFSVSNNPSLRQRSLAIGSDRQDRRSWRDRPRDGTERSVRYAQDASIRRQRTPTAAPKPFRTNDALSSLEGEGPEKEKPHWLIYKEAMKEKLAGESWNPRKKLSPDTMEGIRHLHQTQPERFTTQVLADHFKVSSEAIRRILKSKWRPSDEEQEDRMRRWDKRGEKIWSNLVELGIKPPKKWREMGVGRAQKGEKPRWKTGSRNSVPVSDSFSDPHLDVEVLIPIVDGKAHQGQQRWDNMPLSERLGI